jgi:hypothetical protein
LEQMNRCGLIPYWKREEGIVDQTIFDDFCGSEAEDQAWERYMERHIPLNTGSYGLLTRGMYELQLRPWLRAFDKEQFLVLQLEQMKKEGVEEIMRKVWAHLDLPNHPVEDDSPKNSRDYPPADVEIIEYLQRFFKPHNRRLAQVLGDEWKNVWGCEC